MSRYRSVTKSPLRAILSEVLPYEVPLPFNTSEIYSFLRHLRFQWIDGYHFRVDSRRLGKGELSQLRFIFDGASVKRVEPLVGGQIVFKIEWPKRSSPAKNPYKFTARRNNGKARNLTVLHPYSMLDVARFVDRFADLILYFCSRSSFSIRYPSRVARVAVRKDKIFDRSQDTETFSVAQHGLEYDSLRSFFVYGGFNNINRFYSSSQYRACERKFPFLLRADISKCFDSIYTHSISWVFNGLRASKQNRSSKDPGNLFDKLFQNLNYGETSGIVIGPEVSRIFAEIILQEVDVLTERELREHDLLFGRDYEVKRYVDDYFIFASRQDDAEKIYQTLAAHLSKYKLHFNDQKTEVFSTPLQSALSVAKYRINKDLKKLTQRDVDLEGDEPLGRFFLSAGAAILEYKATLLETGLDHVDLANFYLYSLIKQARQSCKTFETFFQRLEELEAPMKQQAARSNLAKYLIACVDVALFIYAGAPSASHSLKVAELTVLAITELRRWQLPAAELASFEEKLRREIKAQLNTVREARSFGTHTLNLIDCLTFLNTDFDDRELERILKVRKTPIHKLDALALLILIRACTHRKRSESSFLGDLLDRSREIVSNGAQDPEFETERSILLLCIPHNPELSIAQVEQATELEQKDIEAIRRGRSASLFAWNANDNYRERLALKSSGLVY